MPSRTMFNDWHTEVERLAVFLDVKREFETIKVLNEIGIHNTPLN